ncbi:hypothetical protein SAMN05444392_11173 [Seinonella peptonophila]|uniref:HTH cro/C1-type domain-containing protein n=1 Tax=Seinonella peptonophila TaxID=112248 RepID=A0A1M5A111_9BACL|nr:helix-turn-helix transcriptional regulator [Seinonella peptonophila]SHF23572.1 hypothetical protein SAMN05444392_11173 [Seinonella peptonophila]
MEYHYGLTIREGREKLKMTQAQLAEKWPTDNGNGVNVNYVSDVERGVKKITNLCTIRNLCHLLRIPLWKVGLSDYDPFNPTQDKINYDGFIKITDSPNDRISDYKKCLLEAKGNCFISGTSMIHLAEDSAYILKEKLYVGEIHLLILDPGWIKNNFSILTFIDDDDDKKQFHYEIRNSIRKLNQLRKKLPDKLITRLKIKTYSTIFPYIVTGFDNGEAGKLVVEITDYLPEKKRPRFTLQKVAGKQTLYEQIKKKFYSLWNNESITRELQI